MFLRIRYTQWFLLGVIIILLSLIAVPFLLSRSSTTVQRASDANILPLDSYDNSINSHYSDEVVEKINTLYSQIRDNYYGSVGFALLKVDNPSDVIVVGDRLVAPAWATLHIPIAVAAIDNGHFDDDIVGMIRDVDTEVASKIYATLGSTQQASSLVISVLRNAGDTLTNIDPTNARPCNYTSWSVADQATFIANMSLTESGKEVMQLMASYPGSQRYGLGHIDGAVYKSGWGTDFTGDFSVRQFGIIPTSYGDVAVSIIVHAGDGTFGSAQSMLNDFADGIKEII